MLYVVTDLRSDSFWQRIIAGRLNVPIKQAYVTRQQKDIESVVKHFETSARIARQRKATVVQKILVLAEANRHPGFKRALQDALEPIMAEDPRFKLVVLDDTYEEWLLPLIPDIWSEVLGATTPCPHQPLGVVSADQIIYNLFSESGKWRSFNVYQRPIHLWQILDQLLRPGSFQPLQDRSIPFAAFLASL